MCSLLTTGALTDTRSMTDDESAILKPVFKKRAFKGSFKKQEIVVKSEGSAVEDEGDDVDKQRLNDMRELQLLKKRKAGTDVGGMNKGVKSLKRADTEDAKETGISGDLKSQFSANRRMYDDPIGTVAHKDIMERYVEERLGLIDKAKDEEEGYEDREAALDDQAGVFTGIAEVDLGPIYKQKNIEQTEASLKRMRANRRGNRRSGPEEGYEGRFVKPKTAADYRREEENQAMMKGPFQEEIPTVPLPPSEDAGKEKKEDGERERKPKGRAHYQGPVATDLKRVKDFVSRQKY